MGKRAVIRAEIEAAKVVARRNFKRDWGTDNSRVAFSALRKTIPTSASPSDAAAKAIRLIRAGA